MTITQNLTFPIPPKTTIGGMLAAILGIDYNDYFNDPEFFDFNYSLVLEKPVRKKSFAQNYVANYTKKSETKINTIKSYLTTRENHKALMAEKEELELILELREKEKKSLEKVNRKIESESKGLAKSTINSSKMFNDSFKSPKPIFRELIVSPEYLIFIYNFKYEKDILPYLKNHFSKFSLYMGNSEFPANYTYIPCEWRLALSNQLDSFTVDPSIIEFEEGKKYTNVYMATKAVGNREYLNYMSFILCDQQILLSEKKQLHSISTKGGTYCCEFV